jgi:hypothetical protein
VKLLSPNAFFDLCHNEVLSDGSAMTGRVGSDSDQNRTQVSTAGDSSANSVSERLVGSGLQDGSISNARLRQYGVQCVSTLELREED